MRAILILLVVSTLLWLVLQGIRNLRAGDSLEAEPAGVLMPPAAQPPPPAVDPTGDGARKLGEAVAAVRILPASAPAGETPAPNATNAAGNGTAMQVKESAPAPVAQGSDSNADEAALASVLLHRPQDLPAYLEGPAKSLPAGRRDLALALCRLLLGPVDQARRLSEGLQARDDVLVSEAAYVKAVLSSGPRPIEATADRGPSPLILAASLALLEREGKTALAAGKQRDAALAFGELLLGELTAPWKAEKGSLDSWSAALARAQAGHRWVPNGGWSSVEVKVEPGDSLISIRKRALKEHPELLVCTGQIERANALRGETIHPGQVLKVPTSRANVLVDLDARWALYRMGNEVVAAWEVGIGKPGNETPPGEFIVGEKTEEPPWFRPGHAPVPYGDPENPLGSRWIAWLKPDGTNTGLGFHGTKEPDSIGEDRSQGCVRMRQPAIEELFEILPRGASITVRP